LPAVSIVTTTLYKVQTADCLQEVWRDLAGSCYAVCVVVMGKQTLDRSVATQTVEMCVLCEHLE
jgi:hypothetical protein